MLRSAIHISADYDVFPMTCSAEVLFRFYDAEKSLFDKTWKLPDIEKTN